MKTPTIDQPDDAYLSGHLMMLQHFITEIVRRSPDRAEILKSADQMISDFYDALNRREYQQLNLGKEEVVFIGGGANLTLIDIKKDLEGA